ncbi:MAG: 4'-phosphopantetheinyl transferase superfamily protein, partial [Kiritimatiellae bacterium]|nr:4'-phosphopantetheinyl transferase superfamily protein [Kiritimatiellia bacterium]
GIDIERRDRTISDEFAAAAFSATEQEIAAESGEGATALFRFWCAKEALAKALGTGLRFGASDLTVAAFTRADGRIAVRPARLWLQAFPQLRDVSLTVHTCLLDNLVLAVCVLDPAMFGADNAPSAAPH